MALTFFLVLYQQPLNITQLSQYCSSKVKQGPANIIHKGPTVEIFYQKISQFVPRRPDGQYLWQQHCLHKQRSWWPSSLSSSSWLSSSSTIVRILKLTFSESSHQIQLFGLNRIFACFCWAKNVFRTHVLCDHLRSRRKNWLRVPLPILFFTHQQITGPRNAFLWWEANQCGCTNVEGDGIRRTALSS